MPCEYGETVADRIWKENYYNEMKGMTKADQNHWIPIKSEFGDSGFPQADVRECRVYTGRVFESAWIATYLYVFFQDGEYDDPYLKIYIPFDCAMDEDDGRKIVKKTTIEVFKNGLVEVVLHDGRVLTKQLPVPDPRTCWQNMVRRQMDAGWPVKVG